MIEDHHADAAAPPEPPRATARRRPALATALAVLCVLAVVAGIVTAVWLGGRSSDVSAQEQDDLAVRAAAQRFVVTRDTYTPDDVDTYVDQLSKLLTTKYRTEFEDVAKSLAEGITKGQITSSARVLEDNDEIPLVGVSTMDADSATVWVVSDSKKTVGGQQVLRHWRNEVDLVKVDGRWLVDDFKTL